VFRADGKQSLPWCGQELGEKNEWSCDSSQQKMEKTGLLSLGRKGGRGGKRVKGREGEEEKG
jgi:hypothetical protein